MYFGTGLYMRIFVEEVITHSYYPQLLPTVYVLITFAACGYINSEFSVKILIKTQLPSILFN